MLTAEHLNQTKGVVSPFRIQKVRPSELKSFTRILGDELGDVPSSEKLGNAVKLKGSKEAMDDQVESGEEKIDVTSDSEDCQEVPEWLKEGEYVTLGTNKTGIVRYVGSVDFQAGTWVGVELDLPAGEALLMLKITQIAYSAKLLYARLIIKAL